MEIRTARLVLRDFRRNDSLRMFEYHSRYERGGLAREDVEQLVERFCEWAEEAPRTKYQLAITFEGQLIGTCGVRMEAGDATTAEFGCELDREFWGCGYAREAAEALLRFAFDELRIERVIARTTPDNAPAIRLAQTLSIPVELEGIL